MKIRAVLKILKDDGWYELPRKGTSHIQMKHPTKKGKVTLKEWKSDIPIGTLKSIWKQAGLDK